MPHARVGGVSLFYEEAGEGTPLCSCTSSRGSIGAGTRRCGFFARRYRAIAYSARALRPRTCRGPGRVLAGAAADDIRGVLDRLGIARLTCAACRWAATPRSTSGCATRGARGRWSWGGPVTAACAARPRPLQAGLEPRWQFPRDMAQVADMYTRGPTRVQFIDKDPLGWQEFHDLFAAGSAQGHALTMRGVQLTRPSIYELEAGLERLTCPRSIMTGDEDEPCLEPSHLHQARPSALPAWSCSRSPGTRSTSRSPRPSTAPCSTSSPRSTRGNGRSATRRRKPAPPSSRRIRRLHARAGRPPPPPSLSPEGRGKGSVDAEDRVGAEPLHARADRTGPGRSWELVAEDVHRRHTTPSAPPAASPQAPRGPGGHVGAPRQALITRSRARRRCPRRGGAARSPPRRSAASASMLPRLWSIWRPRGSRPR